MDIAIHTNVALPHQVRYAEYIVRGFQRHNLNAVITPDTQRQADLHIVLGPHYAKQQWLNHSSVILLDRCYYKGDPDHVSIGWMNPDGNRTFRSGSKRKPVEIKARKNERGTIFLADYSGPVEHADTVRLHPARAQNNEPLLDALHRHARAVGYTTTALVTAGLEGLEVICRDPSHIMAQPNWRDLLPYADWHYSQIKSGEAWEHLRS